MDKKRLIPISGLLLVFFSSLLERRPDPKGDGPLVIVYDYIMSGFYRVKRPREGEWEVIFSPVNALTR